MIFTVTPNPALDLSGVVDRLVPNEKNYVHSETRFPGGNAINVARLLTRFGVRVTATGFLGKSVGNEVRMLLDEEGVGHDFVDIQGHTRISVTVSNSKTQQQTRLSFPGPKIGVGEIRSLNRKIARISSTSLLVVGGSFPPAFKVVDANRLIRSAQARNIPVVVDLPGHLLRRVRLEGVLLIKPNLTEFQELIGKKVQSVSSIARAARKLARKVHLVCVSSVDGGAILATRDFVWFGSPPPIRLKSTVGAGDSMVAGIVAELWRQKESGVIYNDDSLSAKSYADSLLPTLLRHGLSAAAATLTTSGTQLGNVRDIKNFYRKVVVRELHS